MSTERYEREIRHLHTKRDSGKKERERQRGDRSTSPTDRRASRRGISPTGRAETALQRYYRKKSERLKKMRQRAEKVARRRRNMPAGPVDVDVTEWWEDAGGKDERKFIITLVREDIIGHPRFDELLSTKLKEKVPFESWLSLSVKDREDDEPEIVYDREDDEPFTEEEVNEDLKLIQEEMWDGDLNRVCVLKRVPPVGHSDSVPVPTDHRNVRLLLKALQML